MSAATQDIHAEREVANTTVFLAPLPCVRQRAQWMMELWYDLRFYRRLRAKIRTQQRTIQSDTISTECSRLSPRRAKEIALQFNSAIGPDTLRAYEETHYRVLGDAPATLRIGHANPDLAKLHRAFGVDCSTFVTAANPFSTSTSATANAARQAALAEQLAIMSLRFIEGIGEHPSGTWAGEPSFLVLGLKLSDAKQLGTKHGQNAIVWCGSDTVPQLILLR